MGSMADNHSIDNDTKSSFWKKTNRAVPGRPSQNISQGHTSQTKFPGRPLNVSQKPVAQHKTRATGSTSFQDFEESVSDAWDLGDDEFCIISGMEDTKISQWVSRNTALNVISTHRNSTTASDSVPTLVAGGSAAVCSFQKPSSEHSTTCEERLSFPTYHDKNTNITSVVNIPTRTGMCGPYPAVPGRPHLLKPPVLNFRDGDCESKLERFSPLLDTSLLNVSELQQLSWSGIPVKVRAITWRLLSGYLPASSERRQAVLERKRLDYWNLVKQYYDTERDETYQDTYRQIHIDVPRMNPMVALFQQRTVQEMFERILFIWAIRHPASGYVQGINDLVTPFYMVFLQEVIPLGEDLDDWDVSSMPKEQRDVIEADSFWCLSKFLDCIQDNYIFAQLGIQTKVNQLKDLIKRIDGTLHKHLLSHGVDYLQFSFRWMNNLLTRELPLHCTIRLWDTYLAESDGFATFQLYVCAAFLLQWRDHLMQEKDFQGLMLFLQNLPTHNWTDSEIGLLVAEAYRLKFTFADAPNHLQTEAASPMQI